MDIRLLRYFLGVVDSGSISRAATLLRLAQPSLSRQMRQLEAQVGERLFDRGKSGVRLTPAGRVLVPVARDLVGRSERAEALMRGLAQPDALTIRLLAPETTVADVIAPFLAQLASETPRLDVREALPAAIYPEVIAGAADIGISSGPPPRGLATRLIVHFPIWAYVPRTHRWAGRRIVRVEDLAREPLVVLGDQHGTRRLLDHAMADAGASYEVAAETNVPQVAQALAAAGRGIAVVSDDARYDLHGIRIRARREGELRVPLFGAWDASHYAASAITALVDALGAYAAAR